MKMKALLLAAGIGTRLRPLTYETPKCMIKVGGKLVMEHLIRLLYRYGITDIMVNLHWLPENVYSYFGNKLVYFYEPKLLGEEGTIKAVINWMSDDFVVMNADTLTDVNIQEMYEVHQKAKTAYECLMTAFMDTERSVYAGTWIYTKAYVLSNFFGYIHSYRPGAYWQDIGTREGLRVARLK